MTESSVLLTSQNLSGAEAGNVYFKSKDGATLLTLHSDGRVIVQGEEVATNRGIYLALAKALGVSVNESSERTFFVPKPGEEYDSFNGNRHVLVTMVTFDEHHPEGYVFYGPGEGEETLPLFLLKYRPNPSTGVGEVNEQG